MTFPGVLCLLPQSRASIFQGHALRKNFQISGTHNIFLQACLISSHNSQQSGQMTALLWKKRGCASHLSNLWWITSGDIAWESYSTLKTAPGKQGEWIEPSFCMSKKLLCTTGSKSVICRTFLGAQSTCARQTPQLSLLIQLQDFTGWTRCPRPALMMVHVSVQTKQISTIKLFPEKGSGCWELLPRYDIRDKF